MVVRDGVVIVGGATTEDDNSNERYLASLNCTLNPEVIVEFDIII